MITYTQTKSPQQILFTLLNRRRETKERIFSSPKYIMWSDVPNPQERLPPRGSCIPPSHLQVFMGSMQGCCAQTGWGRVEVPRKISSRAGLSRAAYTAEPRELSCTAPVQLLIAEIGSCWGCRRHKLRAPPFPRTAPAGWSSPLAARPGHTQQPSPEGSPTRQHTLIPWQHLLQKGN